MAGRIPQQFIDEIVARSDIVEIIGTRVPLRKAGREYKACCPFHAEKSPSFSVSPEKQFFHCFGCGAHGTVLGFLMQYEKMEFLDAVADLAQRAGVALPREVQEPRDSAGADLHDVMTRACRFFQQNLLDSASAQHYAEERSIEAETLARFALGYAPDSWDALLNRFGAQAEDRQRLLQAGLVIEREQRTGFYDRFRDRLMFPIRDPRGRILGFGGRVIAKGEPKYMNSPETALFHKGRELYGLYEARQSRADFKRLLIVEGYMDVVRLHQAGITYAVATLGTATTAEHLSKIFRMTSEVVFSFDGDRAGRQAAWRALENALPLALDGRELKFMFLPDGHDPDSLVHSEGRAAFEERLGSALPLSEYLVQHLMADVDLEHVDGRAKLKALAAPLFARMPEGIYREMLAERLAARVGMPAAALKRSFLAPPAGGAGVSRAPPALGKARGEPRGAARTRGSAGRGNLLTQAVALVVHHPSAAGRMGNLAALTNLEGPGIGVLRELLRQAADMPHPTTGMLLERWRDRPEYPRLSELAAMSPIVNDAAAAFEELKMALAKLQEARGPGRRVDELLRKAQELGLNSDEKGELSLLLKEKMRPPGTP